MYYTQYLAMYNYNGIMVERWIKIQFIRESGFRYLDNCIGVFASTVTPKSINLKFLDRTMT